MAMPFRRISKTRKRLRRTHYKAKSPTVVSCQNCGHTVKPHHLCRSCGYYKGKQILNEEKQIKA